MGFETDRSPTRPAEGTARQAARCSAVDASEHSPKSRSDGLVGSGPGRDLVDLDAWPIGCEGGQLASERN